MDAARRHAHEGRGSVLDGGIESLLAEIQVEAHHARLTPAEAQVLQKYGQALLRRSPVPHAVIHLDTTPAACLARSLAHHGTLALEDHAALDRSIRDSVHRLSETGCECYRRRWDTFGKTSAIRDLILCASPTEQRSGAAPPSGAAVERFLCDAWAACQPRSPSTANGRSSRAAPTGVGAAGMSASLPRPVSATLRPVGGPELVPPSSPNLSHQQTRSSAGHSPKSVSPTSIFTRLEDEVDVP